MNIRYKKERYSTMSGEVRKQTAVDRFLDVAEKYPDSPAVEDRHGRFSFRQVEEISNLVAEELVRNLRELRSDAENADSASCAHHNVGVIFPRQKEVLPAFLGILRSANCYVFSAPDAPVGRLNYILQDADISCVITTREAAKSLKIEKPVRLIFMEDVLARYAAGERAGRLYQDAKMEDSAYVTYTSGSTGNPKGVVDTYYYIDNHVGAWHHYYVPKPGECVGSIVSYSYAASTYDLFSGLTVGANLYIFHEEEMMDQVLLDHVVIEKNITSMFMIPSMIPVVFAPGVKLPIRWIITAGEKAKQIPELTAQMAEIYGSSEAAAVLGRITHPGDPWDLLGKPFAGTTLYLLDENGNRITEPGKVGELCIVNDALSAGYLNLPEETFAKFKPCPFLEGRRMYVSGDMMRFDKDGNYYFCGRKDNMTKINGQRVEMGEIESAIVKHPAVEDAVCAVAVRNKTDILVCYYVAKADVAAPGPEELERHTSEKLPRHMVPRYFVQLSEFPKNINGKVDRKSLPEPDFEDWTANVPPEDFAERKLLEIARRILPDIHFGVTDDLMKLGMDSIKAVQFVAEAAEYDPRLTVTDVMRHRSIRAALGAPKQAAWFFAEYDESKPVIVLLHGIIPVSGFSLLCGMWKPYFNIYVIGPFPDYIMQMVGRYDYNDLISLYMRLLDEQIPDRANVWGFAGFSFGGQMAISMAAAWKEKTGRRTHVIMGDTLMQTFRPGKVFPVVTEDDPQMQKILQLARQYGDSAVNEPTEALIKKQNAVVDLLNTIHENTKYDGPVLYLDAKPDYDERMEMFKISVARGLYRNMELAEFPNSHHNELYLNRAMESFYRDYFVRTGALDMCRGTVQAQIRARKGMFTGTAIECGGRTVSYSEFDSAIERIGCHLANAGAGPGCFVAVRMRRSEKMVMAVFGVLWSGAAVVPVNDDIPSKRFRFMMDACKVQIVLDDALYDEIMREGSEAGFTKAAAICPEQGENSVSEGTILKETGACPKRGGGAVSEGTVLKETGACSKWRKSAVSDGGCKWARPEDPAMALFTSGSMGSPKGICHSQASIRRLFVQFPYDAAAVGIRPAAFENVIGHTQPGYVITYNYEYPSALLNGKKLVLLTDTERISAADISTVLERNPKSMLAMVPSQLAVYMEEARFCKAMRHISCLQTWAEPVSDALKGRIGECLVKGSTAINLYGQTETTGIAWQNIFDAKEGAVASLDVDIRIQKEDGSRANAGEKGEICVHSPMQFMGYPGENRIPPNTVMHDGNVYVKTGDMGCLTDEGRLMLLGRGDRMIKFHGQRIELPEIEKAMMDYPGIEAAAVVVCKNAAGVSILAGFYVSLGDRTVSLEEWLAFMRPTLPEFMIPSVFIRLEKMPVGSTGKIDFQSLETRVISTSEGASGQDAIEAATVDTDSAISASGEADGWNAIEAATADTGSAFSVCGEADGWDAMESAAMGTDSVTSSAESADVQDLTEEEKLIITLAAKMLHISESDIDSSSELVMLGIDSLRIVLLTGELKERGYYLTIRDFVRYRTIRELAANLKKQDESGNAVQIGKDVQNGGQEIFGSEGHDGCRETSETMRSCFEIYEATDLQKSYLKNPLRVVNSFEIGIGLTNEQFSERLAEIGEKHPALRSIFFMEDGRYCTRISEWKSLPGKFRDMRRLGPGQLNALVSARMVQLYIEENPETMFYLDAYRTGEESTVLVFAADHRVMDGFSQRILLEEIANGFTAVKQADTDDGLSAEKQGEEAGGLRAKAQEGIADGLRVGVQKETYGNTAVPKEDGYALWLRETHSAEKIREAEGFWRAYLQGSVPACIPVNLAYSGQPDVRSFSVDLDAAQTENLKSKCRACGVSVPSMALYQYGRALLGLLGEESVFFTGALSGRQFDMPGMDKVVGCIVNTVPLKISRQDTPKSFMDQCMTADAYSFLSRGRIMQAAFGKKTVPMTAPFITSEIFPEMGGRVEIRPFMQAHYRNMPEGNVLWEDAEGLHVVFHFDADMWDGGFLEKLVERMYAGLVMLDRNRKMLD